MTLPLVIYRALSALALPFAARRTQARILQSGFAAERARERLGHANLPRPEGRLIWLHGASVGEAKSVLPLSATLVQRGMRVVLTSGTASSGQVIAGLRPDGVLHQFSPLDAPGPVRRFLDYWRPDLAVLVESELWPNLLQGCAANDVPVALLNARLSDRSAARWARFPRTARKLLGGIELAHCQDTRTQNHLRKMGLSKADTGVNLKSILPPLQICKPDLQILQTALEGRPVWVAASTHAGEEESVLAAHRALLADQPDLLLILMPRHPERRSEIEPLLAGFRSATRSTGGQPNASTQIYLADTLGESALWYELAPIVFLGGSFVPVGGHTPFEPAAADCAILHGPLYANFAEVYADFLARNASIQVADHTDLASKIDALLATPNPELAQNARALVGAGRDALDDLAQTLVRLAS